MEEFPSLWSYQENIDELKQKLFYTTIELEAVRTETNEEMKRNNEAMKQLLHHLKIVCQERDDARDQLQKILNKIMPSNDQHMFKSTNPGIPVCFASDQTGQHHQGPMMVPTKANSSVTESNSLSDAYNHSSSPVESLFDPISSPDFSNINVETPFGPQDYHQNNGVLNSLAPGNMPKVDQATLLMDEMIKGKTLPEKGKLLQTVVEAGPLLHTLLVAGPLPRWRNPPPFQAFNIPPMVQGANQIAPAQNQSPLLNSPLMVTRQSQPFAEMACGSSQMKAGGGIVGGGVLSFGDVNFGSNFQGRMMGSYPTASNFSTIGKRQRLH